MTLCKYKDIFGKPGKGIHSIRIFNLAIIDVFFTIVLAFILSILLQRSIGIIMIILFISSIFIHKLFCVKATLTNSYDLCFSSHHVA